MFFKVPVGVQTSVDGVNGCFLIAPWGPEHENRAGNFACHQPKAHLSIAHPAVTIYGTSIQFIFTVTCSPRVSQWTTKHFMIAF